VGDTFLVTPRVLAAIHGHALRIIQTMIDADVFVVGLGHSMGGMIATVQQARHRSLDALAVLGHGGDGLPQFISGANPPTGLRRSASAAGTRGGFRRGRPSHRSRRRPAAQHLRRPALGGSPVRRLLPGRRVIVYD
jgi:hypothetical protein